MSDSTISDPDIDESAALRLILDRLIPPNPARHVYGAGELGLATSLLQQSQSDAILRLAVAKLLQVCNSAEATPHDPSLVDAQLLAFEHRDPGSFDVLLRATYMAYYSRADVRAMLGLSPLPTQPHGYEVPIEPPELLGALLEPVRLRGPCYRTV